MCDCDKMPEGERDKRILDFFKKVFEKYDANTDGECPCQPASPPGTISTEELGAVLGKMGRPTDTPTLDSMMRRLQSNCL